MIQLAEVTDLKSVCCGFESHRAHQLSSENDMSEYYERNPPPFPTLQDKLNSLLKQYYEAEWNNDEVKKLILKQDINSLERRMELGEVYEVPF